MTDYESALWEWAAHATAHGLRRGRVYRHGGEVVRKLLTCYVLQDESTGVARRYGSPHAAAAAFLDVRARELGMSYPALAGRGR